MDKGSWPGQVTVGTFVVAAHGPGQSHRLCPTARDSPRAEPLSGVACAVCDEEPEPSSRAFLPGTVSMPGFRMTGPGAGCPRSLHRRLYLASFRFTLTPSWGTEWFQNKMKLPEKLLGVYQLFANTWSCHRKKKNKIKKWAVSMAQLATRGFPDNEYPGRRCRRCSV